MVQPLAGPRGRPDEMKASAATPDGRDDRTEAKPGDQQKISSDIRDRTKSCMALFEECQGYPLLSEGEWIDKMAAEFNWWSLGIGAAKSGHSSLDYRVQPREDVKSTVVALLDSLAISLKNCIKLGHGFATGSAIPSTEVGDVKGKQLEIAVPTVPNTSRRLSAEQESELDEQRYYIKTTVQFLIRISAAIRKAGTKFRHERADKKLEKRRSELSEFRSYLLNLVLMSSTKNRLLNHLISLQDTANEPIWTKTRIFLKTYFTDIQRLGPIQDRLIRANITRRNRFEVYIEEYHQRLQNHGRLLKSTEPPGVSESPPLQQDYRPTSATAQAQEPKPQKEKQAPFSQSPSKQCTTVPSTHSATKIGSFVMPRRPQEQETRSVSTKVSQGAIKQDYPNCPAAEGETFWCPYCAQLLDSSYAGSNNKRWRGHLAEDLSPYVCVYQDCDNPDEMYVTTVEWKKHIKERHGQDRWICDPCWVDSDDPGQYEFSCQDDWFEHTITKHQNEVEEDDLLDLAEASQRTVVPPVMCPLCHEDTALLDPGTDNHLAEHLHSFALQALPWEPLTADDDTRVSVGPNIERAFPLEDAEDFSDESEEVAYNISDLSSHIEATRRFCGKLTEWKPLTSLLVPIDLLNEVAEALQQLSRRFTLYHSYLKHDIAVCLTRFCRIFQTLEESDVGVGSLNPKDLEFLVADITEGLESLDLIISSGNRRLPGDFTVRVIPFERNEDFVHRSELSQQLDKLLALSSEFRAVALWGVGGSGKTQMALEYAYQRSEDPACSVFWVNASSEETFVRSFRLIAGVLGLDNNLDDATLLAAVRDRIQIRQLWVLILDDAKDLVLLGTDRTTKEANTYDKYLPRGSGGTLLWTTKDKNIARSLVGSNQGLEVGPMTLSEGTTLLLNILNSPSTIEERAMTALWKQMDGLALGIAQAGAVVRRGRVSPEELLKGIEEDKLCWDTLEEGDPDPRSRLSYSTSLLKTYMLAIRHIRQESEMAHRILAVIAYLDPETIWPEIITAICTEISENLDQVPSDSQIEQALECLTRMAMISTPQVEDGVEPQVYTTHRIMQSAVRESLINEHASEGLSQGKKLGEEGEPYFSGIALRVISKFFPSPRSETLTLCERYLPHVMRVSEWAYASGKEIETVRLLDRVAEYFEQRENWKEKEAVCNRILELRRHKFGEKHPDTIKSMWDLGSTYHAQASFDKSEDFMVEVLDLQQQVLGKRHPDTIWTMAYLAANYQHQDKYAEAENVGKQALHLQREVLGNRHPDTISSMTSLAATYQYRRQYEKAEALGLEAFELQEELLGHEHPDTIKTMSSLAATYQHMGLFEEAEAFGLRAFDLHEDVLGEEHPDTMWSMASLAMIYNAQGQVDAAQEHGTRAFSVHQKVLGEKHPDTLHAMHNLALIWDKSNRLDDALHLMRECFELRRLVLGPDHLSTRASGERLAELRWKSWSSRPQIRHVVSQTDEGGREKESKDDLLRNRRRARSLVDEGTSA